MHRARRRKAGRRRDAGRLKLSLRSVDRRGGEGSRARFYFIFPPRVVNKETRDAIESTENSAVRT